MRSFLILVELQMSVASHDGLGTSPTFGYEEREAVGCEDVARVWLSLDDSYPVALSRAIPEYHAYMEKIARYGITRYCVTVDGEVVGAVSLYANDDETHHAYITQLAVSRNHRHEGIGSHLVMRACEIAREGGMCGIRLEVLEDNDAARGLYRALGFTPMGERGRYGLLMERSLTDGEGRADND